MRSGDYVFMINEDVISMFVIISGCVCLWFLCYTSSGDEIIRERGRGDIIGEVFLFVYGKYFLIVVILCDIEFVRMLYGVLKLINVYYFEVLS